MSDLGLGPALFITGALAVVLSRGSVAFFLAVALRYGLLAHKDGGNE